MTSPSKTSSVPNQRETSADELFKNLLKSTKLTAQIPAKNGRRENYICENSKPALKNLTELCASKEATVTEQQRVADSTVRTIDTNQPIQGQITTNSAEAPQTQSAKESNKLELIYQALYVAQAQVQLEVKQIQRAQSLAAAQQKALEEASMNVRTITGALHAAQQDVATAAMRAQTAQLQLAAHDQLLFAARQKVDALSSQAVGLQAEESIVLPNLAVDIQTLLAKLKAPLPEILKPTPIPAMCPEMEAKLALSLTSQSPLESKDKKEKDLIKTIREIFENRNKNYIKKRSINEKEDLNIFSDYDNYFYRWFIKDIRNERRKRRLARKMFKSNYNTYND